MLPNDTYSFHVNLALFNGFVGLCNMNAGSLVLWLTALVALGGN